MGHYQHSYPHTSDSFSDDNRSYVLESGALSHEPPYTPPIGPVYIVTHGLPSISQHPGFDTPPGLHIDPNPLPGGPSITSQHSGFYEPIDLHIGASPWSGGAADSGYGSSCVTLRKELVTDVYQSAKSKGKMRKKDWEAYSDTSSLRTTRLDNAIFEIAQEVGTLLPPSIERVQLRVLSRALPVILEDFAFRIGQEDPETTCCRLMYLVHRYNS